MKRILILITLMNFMFISCQNRIDLEQLTFKENLKELLKNKKTFEEDWEITTSLPTVYTYEGQYFKLNDINLNLKDQVGFLLKNKQNIAGVYMYIYDIQEDNEKRGDKLLKYLKNKYPNYELLGDSRETRTNELGLKGMLNYMWRLDNNRAMILSQDYNLIDNDNKLLSTYLYIIDSNIKDKDPNANRTVIERLIKTYTL